MSSSSILLKAIGLDTSPNSLAAPDGALVEALNVIIRRDNVIEPRRGFKLYGNSFGSSSDRAKQVLTYKNRILRHYSTIMSYDDGTGTFTDFSGTFSEPTTGYRIKSIEANGNLYFTTDTGVKRISAASASEFTANSGYIQNAGGIKATDIQTRLNIQPNVESAFFTQDSTVGYRVVWGTIDANNNLILGTPSQYNQIYNPLVNLIQYDFNRTLGALDDIGSGITPNTNASGTVIDNEDYMARLALTESSPATTIRTSLISLVTKLDTDFLYANDTGTNAQLTISAAAISAAICTITFSAGTPSTFFSIGSKIFLSGFTNTGGLLINGAQVVTAVTPTTITFSTTAVGAITVTGCSVNSNEYRGLTDSSGNLYSSVVVPSTPPTNSQLVYLQAYLNAILTRLKLEPTAAISLTLQTNYISVISLTTTATVDIDVTVPSGITTDYFFQIYRSAVAPASATDVLTSTVFPNDELQQVYEAYPTQAQITSGLITIEDIVLDFFRGANLYTNPYSGEGITQANDIPPFCHDINRYKNSVFYANTRTRHRLAINLLGVINMIADYNAGRTPKVTITNSVFTNTYSFILGVNQIASITAVAASSLVSAAAPASYFLIHSAKDQRAYYVWYSQGSATDPAVSGYTGIKVLINTTDSAGLVALKTANVLNRYILDFKNGTTATGSLVTGNVTSTSTSIPSVSSVVGLSIGMVIYATNSSGVSILPVNTTITNIVGTTLTISAAALASQTGAGLSFGGTTVQNLTLVDSGYTTAPAVGTSGFTIVVGTSGKGERLTKTSTTYAIDAGSAFNNSGTANYFTLNGAYNRPLYYVWFQKGTASDPAISGRTGIEVSILNADTAAQVITKAIAAINTIAGTDFTASGTSTLIIQNDSPGPSNASTASMPGGYSATITQVGAAEVLLSSNVFPSQAVDETARSLVRIINENASEAVYAYYLSAVQGVPGQMNFESKSLDENVVYVLGNNANTGASFNPSIAPTHTITNITAADPTVISSTAHGLTTTNLVVITGSDSVPTIDGIHTVGTATTNTFDLDINVITSGTTGALVSAMGATFSTNEVKPNRLYFSKFQQPDAVPILNYMDVGAVNKAILRIFPLRDSLFVFKEDGLWRISGDSAPYNDSLFDSSCVITAPDSVDVCNNLIYGWSTEGITTVSESGTKIISRPIDVDTVKLGALSYNRNFGTVTWGFGYESDQSYIVYVPQTSNDTYSTLGYRFCNLTNSWTKFNISATCGVVNSGDDQAYLGAGDTNFVLQERKSFNRTDYADREIDSTLTIGTYLSSGARIQLGTISGITVGDVLTQTQTITAYEFNQFLKKIDLDPGLSVKTYFANYEVSGGDDLALALYNPNDITGLAVALDSEPNLVNHIYVDTVSQKTGSITSNSADAESIITTSAPHGMVTGRTVQITGVSGSIPDINGTYTIGDVTSNTFTIPFNVTVGGTGGTYATQSDFDDLKAVFDGVCANLVSDSGTSFKNYESMGTTSLFESVITAIDINSRTVTLLTALPFIAGPLIIYNSIPSTFTYAPNTIDAPIGFKTYHPQSIGDPMGLKHIREATIMFENQAFTNATLSFASDLNPFFSDIIITGNGSGTFGNSAFGEGYFGGIGSTVPFRTYVPAFYQRCRYIVVKFAHSVAREKYSIFGTTLTGEIAQSTRAYR